MSDIKFARAVSDLLQVKEAQKPEDKRGAVKQVIRELQKAEREG